MEEAPVRFSVTVHVPEVCTGGNSLPGQCPVPNSLSVCPGISLRAPAIIAEPDMPDISRLLYRSFAPAE